MMFLSYLVYSRKIGYAGIMMNWNRASIYIRDTTRKLNVNSDRCYPHIRIRLLKPFLVWHETAILPACGLFVRVLVSAISLTSVTTDFRCWRDIRTEWCYGIYTYVLIEGIVYSIHMYTAYGLCFAQMCLQSICDFWWLILYDWYSVHLSSRYSNLSWAHTLHTKFSAGITSM